MTKLLVSVRSAAEAKVAVAGGADIIDVKEPRHGALGAADPEVWHEILALVDGRAVTSAALGELLDEGVERRARQTAGFQYAKIGLAGCHAQRGWIARWLRVIRELPPDVQPVPVAYADWPRASAPSPSVALAIAQDSLARLLLVDTHNKRAGGLLDILSLESLHEIAHHARQVSVQLALAGSLDAATIAALRALCPAYVGVRGAACRGGRAGRIDLARVKTLAQLVHGKPQKAAS